MKSYTFRLTLLLVLIFAVAHLTAEECPPENCVPEDQCSIKVQNGGTCTNGNKCCSVVKTEYKTHCRHFFGACLNKCNDRVWIREAVDCADNQRCCILI
ncbi:hypothetical protein HZH66_010095 [Vespula vulgaris]|uniref:Uncharacterized protein n=1 Tax=Vespula vulgaris TaxID=7454 RepID=A0A834JID4_VESVU|nr:uncharacterized protein LOC127067498 [Vespula vulgaris]KAF7388958.1 hypothetical protein HZH66_010095 [Vespula vulgaris]